MYKNKVILGSASPRRKLLLNTILNDYKIIIPNIDENVKFNETAVNYALRMAQEKFANIAEKAEDQSII